MTRVFFHREPNDHGEILWEPVKSPTINYLHIKNGLLEQKDGFQKSEIEFLYSLPINEYF